MATLEREITTAEATRLSLRLSRAQAEKLERAAKAAGQSPAEFAASAI